MTTLRDTSWIGFAILRSRITLSTCFARGSGTVLSLSQATECYLKVSFPPYLLEVDLDGCIDSTQPKARVENGTLLIKARKKEGSVGLWGSLGQPVDRKCDPEVKARREESIKEKLKQEQEVGKC